MYRRLPKITRIKVLYTCNDKNEFLNVKGIKTTYKINFEEEELKGDLKWKDFPYVETPWRGNSITEDIEKEYEGKQGEELKNYEESKK